MYFDDFKSALASKTIWGALVAILATGINFLGYQISSGDQAALVEALTGLATVAGSLFAIYGRVAARKRIG